MNDPSARSAPEPTGPRDPTVVVAAHGSRSDAANEAHRDLVDTLGTGLSAVTVVAAFLELAGPTIPEAIDSAVASGSRVVRVLPYFLHPGRHAVADMADIVEQARTRHRDVDVALAPPFGADPALVAVLTAQIRAAYKA